MAAAPTCFTRWASLPPVALAPNNSPRSWENRFCSEVPLPLIPSIASHKLNRRVVAGACQHFNPSVRLPGRFFEEAPPVRMGGNHHCARPPNRGFQKRQLMQAKDVAAQAKGQDVASIGIDLGAGQHHKAVLAG